MNEPITSLKQYLARFPAERVDTDYAQGGSGMFGREGSYYCAGCGVYMGDVYSNMEDTLPLKNQSSGHCTECLSGLIDDEDYSNY